MDLVKEYNLKVGDKIETNGDGHINGDRFTGKIIYINDDSFYVGRNEISGEEPPVKVDYFCYKYSWVITRDNENCFVKKINTNAKYLNK
jgi:hypothetical protein